jgi:hypothetical protein
MGRRSNMNPCYHVVNSEGRSLCGTRRPFWQAVARGLACYSQYAFVRDPRPLPVDMICKTCYAAVKKNYINA